jgi:DNA polymerase IV
MASLEPMSALTILHVDMDAFYATVEQRDRPELQGRPVIVGGSAEGRGVVCAASYEARRFGVHSAMATVTARRLCPEGVFLPVRMDHYANISRQIRAILLSFTPLVEPLSLDEAYLDIRGSEALFGPAPAIARRIKDRIRAETGLVASVGVAANKFLAKLASDTSKPDGLLVIEADQAQAFLTPLPVSRLWGVGAKGQRRLKQLGIDTIGELAALTPERLAAPFGQFGRQLWELAHGRDDRPVVPDREARSISTETTFARDIGDREVLRAWLFDLVEQLSQRIRQAGVQASTLELKLRSADFRTHTRSVKLIQPTDVTPVLWKAAAGLFDQRIGLGLLPARLLGVGATGLVRHADIQGNLFDDGWEARQRLLDQTLDRIRDQFGSQAIQRGPLRPGSGQDSL